MYILFSVFFVSAMAWAVHLGDRPGSGMRGRWPGRHSHRSVNNIAFLCVDMGSCVASDLRDRNPKTGSGKERQR